jgi:hypothetical protein
MGLPYGLPPEDRPQASSGSIYSNQNPLSLALLLRTEYSVYSTKSLPNLYTNISGKLNMQYSRDDTIRTEYNVIQGRMECPTIY